MTDRFNLYSTLAALALGVLFFLPDVKAGDGADDPHILADVGCFTCWEKVEETATSGDNTVTCWDEAHVFTYELPCESVTSKHTFYWNETCDLGQECAQGDYTTDWIRCPSCEHGEPHSADDWPYRWIWAQNPDSAVD